MVLDYLSGQDNGCRLRVVGNWYAMSGYGFGFPKQSKFKEMINKEIVEMHHSGEIERLRRFWFTGKHCSPFSSSNLRFLGACKTSVIQNPQRSSQPLDVSCFLRHNTSGKVMFSLVSSKEISHPLFFFYLLVHSLQ